jgi:myo-inositol catabolism protein IolS
MQYRENKALAKSLSVLGLGGAAVSGEGGGYGFGPMDEKQAEALLRASWEAGINLYDTAPIYGFGLSEERFGRYLPQEAVIVTKGGVDWHSSKRVNMTNDPKVIEKMMLESLKRLRRDWHDVYMIHWPDPRVDIRRPLEVLRKYQEKSVIKEIGLCNTNLDDLKKAHEVAPITFLQSELNAYSTRSFDELEGEWKKYFTMSWGTFDKGILTGRVDEQRKFDQTDCRSWAPWWNKKEVASKIERVKKLQRILADYNISLMQFCLQFNLKYFALDSCLIGLKNNKDLVEATSNLQKIIPAGTLEEVLKQWGS